jgi:hypothetical protein
MASPSAAFTLAECCPLLAFDPFLTLTQSIKPWPVHSTSFQPYCLTPILIAAIIHNISYFMNNVKSLGSLCLTKMKPRSGFSLRPQK